MTFTDGYRVERVYFERLKSLITILKSLKDGAQDETVRTLIENAIDSDGAILLLYRNLGEAWAELADQAQKTRKMLQDLDEKTEKYHDELNERIDEVNNYLMALIRALEARMDAVEADLAQMGRLYTYDLQRVNDEYTLTESGQPVTWAGTVEKVQHVRPHFVTVRGSLDGEVTYLMPREYDTAQASGIFEWYSVGFVGNEIHEVTVTLLPDDSVNVAIHTTDFASILQRISTLETRVTTAEGDIDTLEQTAENHNDRITDLEECCDDMTENVIPGLQTAIAGKQDALTPGTGIDITGNVISADTDVLQEKLVAGSGISIDPTTHEIVNTAQGVIYTPGDDIDITNNVIKVKGVSPFFHVTNSNRFENSLVLNPSVTVDPTILDIPQRVSFTLTATAQFPRFRSGECSISPNTTGIVSQNIASDGYMEFRGVLYVTVDMSQGFHFVVPFHELGQISKSNNRCTFNILENAFIFDNSDYFLTGGTGSIRELNMKVNGYLTLHGNEGGYSDLIKPFFTYKRNIYLYT